MKIKIVVFAIILFMIISTFTASANLTTEKSFDGYTLYTPEFSKNTYLINNNGEVVHEWKSRYRQALPVYLLENGSLLRSSFFGRSPRLGFLLGGFTGGVEMLDWDGNLIWEFVYSDRSHYLHNDIEPLPNGNILIIVWNHKTRAEAIAAGCDPKMLRLFAGILTESIIEVEPIYPSGGNIVWEWNAWDHLIQDYDSKKDNYGVVAYHPELIDINCDRPGKYPSLLSRLRRPFYLSEFLHINSIDYNEELDQIVLSSVWMSEIFIIDHSTTTEEAKGHTGGSYGKGGDLLYRWGNPQNYDRGDENDQKLFSVHDPRWIEPGCPGEGHITIYNNGVFRPDARYSSIEEIILPVDENGNYVLEPDSTYGPEEPVWTYIAKNPTDFFSPHISGAQRLSNGNTLICEGAEGHFFEVTPEKEIVWEYVNKLPLSIYIPRVGKLNEVFKTQTYPPDYPGLQKLKMD